MIYEAILQSVNQITIGMPRNKVSAFSKADRNAEYCVVFMHTCGMCNWETIDTAGN